MFCSEARTVVEIASGEEPPKNSVAMLQTEQDFIVIDKPTIHSYPKKSKVSKVSHPKPRSQSDRCKADCRVDDGCCSDGCVVQQQCLYVDPSNGLIPPNVYTAQKLCSESNGNWCPGPITDAAVLKPGGTQESWCEKNCNIKNAIDAIDAF